jgi:hypothetical protein
MSYIRSVKRTASVALAVCSALIGTVLFAPSALALIAPLSGASIAVPPQPHPAVFHNVVAGGLAGWQITIIAVGSALFGVAVAVFFDHTRAARRRHTISAA